MNEIINERKFLNSIKSSLGHPYNVIELSDNEILEIITVDSNMKFSKFFPLEKKITLTTDDKIEYNSYKLKEEYRQLNIINLKKVLFYNTIQSQFLMSNDPVDRAVNFLMEDVNKNIISFNFDNYNGIVTILGNYTNSFSILCIFEVLHEKDLTSIPINLFSTFKTIALGDVSERLLFIRNKFQNVTTTFGEINLNLDFLQQNIEKRDTLLSETLRKAGNLSKRLPVFVQ